MATKKEVGWLQQQDTIKRQEVELEQGHKEREDLLAALSEMESKLAAREEALTSTERKLQRLKSHHVVLKERVDTTERLLNADFLQITPRAGFAAPGDPLSNGVDQARTAASPSATPSSGSAPQPPLGAALSPTRHPEPSSPTAPVASKTLETDKRVEVEASLNSGVAVTTPHVEAPSPTPSFLGGTTAGTPPKPASVAPPTPPTPEPARVSSRCTSRDTGVGSPTASSPATSPPATNDGNGTAAAPSDVDGSGDPSPTPAVRPTTGDARAYGDGGRGEGGDVHDRSHSPFKPDVLVSPADDILAAGIMTLDTERKA